jgi:hypothetical protein
MNSAWIQGIQGLLIIPVLAQYLHLRQPLQGHALSSEIDRVMWSIFDELSLPAMFAGQFAVLGANEVWKVKGARQMQILPMASSLDRCWTAERRHRHGL